MVLRLHHVKPVKDAVYRYYRQIHTARLSAQDRSFQRIHQLIISTPYEEPAEHWKYDRETRRFSREPRGIQPGGAHGGEAKSYFTGEDKIIIANEASAQSPDMLFHCCHPERSANESERA